MKRVVVSCLVMVLFLMPGAAARADQRNYVWTYEYHTLARDSTEIEFYQTAVTMDKQMRSASDWTQQVELEYGITDHFDAALYEVYEQPAGSAMQYAGYKIRLRYRIAEKNDLPVDVLLYAEHVENTGAENEFEGKVILAKDIGKLNIAYNQIFEKEYRSGSGAGHEYAAGMSYELSPRFRIGLETKGSYKEDTCAAGPTLAWSGGRIWANIGAVYGLNHRTNDREVRFLLGIPF